MGDGFAINTTKALHLPLDCFADSEVATFDSEELPGITISYPQLAEFWTKRRGSNTQNNPCWERKALARNRDGQPRRGSVLRPQLEKSLLIKRWNFATQKTRWKGAQWSRTVIFEVRLGVLWMNR